MAINTFFAEYKQITMRVFCLYIRKMSAVPVYRPFPYNVFAYVLDGQVYKKEIKLQIMTMCLKVIFTNMHNRSNVCTESFGK